MLGYVFLNPVSLVEDIVLWQGQAVMLAALALLAITLETPIVKAHLRKVPIWVIMLTNFVTNIALNAVLNLSGISDSDSIYVIAVSEALLIPVIEALVYFAAARKQEKLWKCFLISYWANATSFIFSPWFFVETSLVDTPLGFLSPVLLISAWVGLINSIYVLLRRIKKTPKDVDGDGGEKQKTKTSIRILLMLASIGITVLGCVVIDAASVGVRYLVESYTVYTDLLPVGDWPSLHSEIYYWYGNDPGNKTTENLLAK